MGPTKAMASACGQTRTFTVFPRYVHNLLLAYPGNAHEGFDSLKKIVHFASFSYMSAKSIGAHRKNIFSYFLTNVFARLP